MGGLNLYSIGSFDMLAIHLWGSPFFGVQIL